MPKLVLVKHSVSNHNPFQPSAEWELTEDGIKRCQPLAQRIKAYHPQRLFSSPMPRALRTAKFVSQALGDIPVREHHLLAEHSRNANAPYGSVLEFEARIKRLFDAPDELAFGDETGNQAQRRFQRGSSTVLDRADSNENIVVIAHGTVIVLFAAQYNALDSYDLWQRLAMPSLLELNLPDMIISKVIEDAGLV